MLGRGSRLRTARTASVLAAILVAAAQMSPLAASSPGRVDSAVQRSGSVVQRGRVIPAQAARYADEHPRPAAGSKPRLEGPTRSGFEIKDARSGQAAGARRPLISAPSDPISTGAFAGIAFSNLGGIEPPDPWIAVNSAHVVQAVNWLVRISTRSGEPLVTVPTWAFFGLDPTEQDADPRIIWDPAHGRWVGVLLSWVGDFPTGLDAGYITLAISTSADPTGAWDVYTFPYADELGVATLPDFPGLASSIDKIVVAVNEYQPGPTFLGSSILVVTWSSILAGSVAGHRQSIPDPTLWRIRPAQVLSTSPDVHLVAEDSTTGDVLYQKVTGAGSDFSATGWVDLTSTIGVDVFGVPPAPAQPGSPSTILEAVQDGPTDAVWRSGHLWFVATDSVTFDGGATFVDAVRVTELETTAATPTVLQTRYIATAGYDTYMGGVGLSGEGAAFVVFTESSPGQFTTSKFTTYTAAYGWSPSVTIEAGDATYAGARWGDYVGVAADPAGTAAVWQANEVAASDGTWRTVVSRLIFDLVPPTTTAPTQAFVVPATLGSTVPVSLSWTGADATSGIAGYTIGQDVDGAGWESLESSAAGTSVTRSVFPSGHTYRYRVQAVDGYGNLSTPATGPDLAPALAQQTASGVTYSGTWRSAESTVYSGGSVRYATAANARATYTFSGRNVAIVATKSRTRGSFKVYVDGAYQTTVSLFRATSLARQLVYQHGWATSGSHRIQLVVLGTSGHPRVDLDAFVVLK
jgi:hypothetical protein